MRWKTKIKKPPQRGDKKTVIKFALWPVRIGGQTVWLEQYRVEYKYFPASYRCSPWWEHERYLLDN